MDNQLKSKSTTNLIIRDNLDFKRPQIPSLNLPKLQNNLFQSGQLSNRYNQGSQLTKSVSNATIQNDSTKPIKPLQLRQSIEVEYTMKRFHPPGFSTSRNTFTQSQTAQVHFQTQYQQNHDKKQNTLADSIAKYKLILPRINNSSFLQNSNSEQESALQSYRVSGMFKENTMNKADHDKQKFDYQKQRLKDLLERQKSHMKMNQDKVNMIIQFHDLNLIKNVPSDQKLMNMSLPELDVKLKKLQINQKVSWGVLKIQGGWKMHKTKKDYKRLRRHMLEIIIRIQRIFKRFLLKKEQLRHKFMNQKVNSSLSMVDNIRERVYEDAVKKIICSWRDKTILHAQERKQNAYKAFLYKSIEIYNKHKKIQQKKVLPRYMQNLKRTHAPGGPQVNAQNTSSISHKQVTVQNNKAQQKAPVVQVNSSNLPVNNSNQKQSLNKKPMEKTKTNAGIEPLTLKDTQTNQNQQKQNIQEQQLYLNISKSPNRKKRFTVTGSIIIEKTSSRETSVHRQTTLANDHIQNVLEQVDGGSSQNDNESPSTQSDMKNQFAFFMTQNNLSQDDPSEQGDNSGKEYIDVQDNNDEQNRIPFLQQIQNEANKNKSKFYKTTGQQSSGTSDLTNAIERQTLNNFGASNQKNQNTLSSPTFQKKLTLASPKKVQTQQLQSPQKLSPSQQMPIKPQLDEMQKSIDNVQSFKSSPKRGHRMSERRLQGFDEILEMQIKPDSKPDPNTTDDQIITVDMQKLEEQMQLKDENQLTSKSKKSPQTLNKGFQHQQNDDDLINWNTLDDKQQKTQNKSPKSKKVKIKKNPSKKKVDKALYDKDEIFGEAANI
ncbi:UNKNOWN [Stylonychia lemnae]|uniref:Iq calmodulin-binding motif family protein n=1 Tax=Stylonychia lemnae TaxID=5949 RepID=A0A077ZTJ0_STYLE|nr:UNKNOWN [Stylonychia lemnae]|eukprot:CDW73233.1 UNKNOWN [Stylonychia lemnae]